MKKWLLTAAIVAVFSVSLSFAFDDDDLRPVKPVALASAGGGQGGGGAGQRVTYYFNCNSSNTPQTPTFGANSVTIDAGFNVVQGTVGVGALELTATGNAAIETSVTDVIRSSQGAVGFFYWPISRTDGASVWSAKAVGGTTGQLGVVWDAGQNRFTFRYEDAQGVMRNMVNGTTYYVENFWDHTKANTWCVRSVVSLTTRGDIEDATASACTEGTPTMDALLKFGADSANVTKGGYDEIRVSTSPTTNFFADRFTWTPPGP